MQWRDKCSVDDILDERVVIWVEFRHRLSYPTKTGISKKVQVGKDQEKAQSEKDSHSKNQGGKKPN